MELDLRAYKTDYMNEVINMTTREKLDLLLEEVMNLIINNPQIQQEREFIVICHKCGSQNVETFAYEPGFHCRGCGQFD